MIQLTNSSTARNIAYGTAISALGSVLANCLALFAHSADNSVFAPLLVGFCAAALPLILALCYWHGKSAVWSSRARWAALLAGLALVRLAMSAYELPTAMDLGCIALVIICYIRLFLLDRRLVREDGGRGTA